MENQSRRTASVVCKFTVIDCNKRSRIVAPAVIVDSLNAGVICEYAVCNGCICECKSEKSKTVRLIAIDELAVVNSCGNALKTNYMVSCPAVECNILDCVILGCACGVITLTEVECAVRSSKACRGSNCVTCTVKGECDILSERNCGIKLCISKEGDCFAILNSSNCLGKSCVTLCTDFRSIVYGS